MLDLSHIPNSQQDIKVFYSNGVSNAWQTWQKPRKCSYVWIMCIGAGAGGAGGSSSVGAGATGGASGGVSRALYNAQQLPDTLYVQVGVGGAGGNPGVSGIAGTRSWVFIQPAIVNGSLVQGSGAVAAVGGLISGVASAGETPMTQGTAYFLTLANFIGTAGQPSNTALTYSPLTSQITCPGGVGPQYNDSTLISFAGGEISATSISPTIPGGTNGGGTTNGGDGGYGITSWKPFFSLGGAGGGSSYVGSGGNGGNGGIGSGGGAGGAGKTGGGRGGKGGDGLVVIIAF